MASATLGAVEGPSALRVDGGRLPRVVSSLRRAYENYITFAVRLFGRPARQAADKHVKLRHSLEQAHIPLLTEAFIALTWLNTAVATVALYLVVVLVLVLASGLGVALGTAAVAVLLVVPIMLGASVYVVQMTYPDYRAGERRRLIERELPYAVNYIAALSSAGVIPTTLIRDLAREPTYGEVAREMAWIVRDLDLLGVDLLTALQRAIARSPSRRFQEFLQGAKTTILSGGELQSYFSAKAEQYMGDNRRTQKEFLESLGIMAESYVTVVIAGPLFMIVMLSIMLVVGRSTSSSELFLFSLIFVMLPIAHSAFAWVLKNLTPEG